MTTFLRTTTNSYGLLLLTYYPLSNTATTTSLSVSVIARKSSLKKRATGGYGCSCVRQLAIMIFELKSRHPVSPGLVWVLLSFLLVYLFSVPGRILHLWSSIQQFRSRLNYSEKLVFAILQRSDKHLQVCEIESLLLIKLSW